MQPKTITLLGSTGSIGESTLDVVRRHPTRYAIHALSTHVRAERLLDQIREFRPAVVVVTESEALERVRREAPAGITVLAGPEGLETVAADGAVDFVMAGIVGAAGLKPFIAALESGKTIGLANKEVLVMAGEYLHQRYGDSFLKQIIPVDSEHSAIFQCLGEQPREAIESIILTASGGPFRTRQSLEGLTPQEALQHPNWNMGPKISVDSATLMNKGLEMIEAYWLFPVALEQIRIIIHPQSVIHSMVSFRDGSILAHLGNPDMRIPIQYALSHPERLAGEGKRLDFGTLAQLTFENPDFTRFPCLTLATDAIRRGHVYPAVLNAANEVAVAHFLKGQLAFQDIARCNGEVLQGHHPGGDLNLQTLLEADTIARKEAHQWISQHLSPI